MPHPALARLAESRGNENLVPAAAYVGGIASRQLASVRRRTSCCFPIPALRQEHHASVLAAALFGEGMSSPLLDPLRERRGLVYHAACSADVLELCGQFVIEASTAPEHEDEFFVEVTRLLLGHAEGIDAIGLERARHQIAVRSLRTLARPSRRPEAAALDLFALGRVRSRAETMAGIEAVTAQQVREAFAGMLAAGASIGIAGKMRRGLKEQVLGLARPLLHEDNVRGVRCR